MNLLAQKKFTSIHELDYLCIKLYTGKKKKKKWIKQMLPVVNEEHV